MVAENGFHIKYGDVDIHFSHSLAIDGPRLTLTPRADIVCVFDQSLSYTTARLVDLHIALWEQDGVYADTTKAGSTGVLARFLEDILVLTSDQELGLLHVNAEPFTLHATFHALSLEIYSSLVSAISTRSSV